MRYVENVQEKYDSIIGVLCGGAVAPGRHEL